jgi:Outer membrane protein
MKKSFKLLILLLLLAPLSVSAQQRWSLQKCVEYAWENNLSIKQQELNIEQSENNLQQSKLNYIPSVNTSASHSMNWGRSVNMNDLQIIQNKLSENTSASVRASVNLFEGFAKSNEIKSNNIVRDISVQEVDRLKNNISIEISRSYLQILLSKEIVKSAQESLNSVEAQVDRTKKMVEQGSVAYSSLLEIEAQLASEKVQLVNAKNQHSTALLALMQLLDLEYSVISFDIEDINVDLMVKDFHGESIEQLFETSTVLPQIKISELSLQNSNIQLNMAKGRAMPTLSFSAGFGTSYSNLDMQNRTFFEQFKDNRNPSMSFSLSIPIFSSHQIRTGIKNAKLAVQKAEIDVRSSRQLLYKEIQQSSNDASASYERYRASETNVKAMQESFRYVQEKFELGVLNATDYTVARTNLFKATSDYHQSKYQYVFQLKILDFYRGVPISL